VNCPYCQSLIDDSMKFCTNCGAPVVREPENNTSEGMYSENNVNASAGMYTESNVNASAGMYTESNVNASAGMYTESNVNASAGMYTESNVNASSGMYTENTGFGQTSMYSENPNPGSGNFYGDNAASYNQFDDMYAANSNAFAAYDASYYQPEKKKKSKLPIILLIIVAVVVLLLGCCCCGSPILMEMFGIIDGDPDTEYSYDDTDYNYDDETGEVDSLWSGTMSLQDVSGEDSMEEYLTALYERSLTQEELDGLGDADTEGECYFTLYEDGSWELETDMGSFFGYIDWTNYDFISYEDYEDGKYENGYCTLTQDSSDSLNITVADVYGDYAVLFFGIEDGSAVANDGGYSLYLDLEISPDNEDVLTGTFTMMLGYGEMEEVYTRTYELALERD